MSAAAVAFDQAVVQVYGRLRNGKSEPGTLRPAADHRVENTLCDFAGNPGAVVDDIKTAHHPVIALANGEVALNAGAQPDHATLADHARFLEGLHGVANDIEYCLDELLPVAKNVGDARIVIA